MLWFHLISVSVNSHWRTLLQQSKCYFIDERSRNNGNLSILPKEKLTATKSWTHLINWNVMNILLTLPLRSSDISACLWKAVRSELKGNYHKTVIPL